MKKLAILFLPVLVLACAPSKKEDLSSLRKEVMLIHDDVMPKMGELRSTQKKLLALADSAGSDSLAAQKYRELANTIQLANESMMDWMRNYDPNFDGSEDETKAYLEDQRKKIQQVKIQMDSSLEEGLTELDSSPE